MVDTTVEISSSSSPAMHWKNNALYLLDQRKLPFETTYEKIETAPTLATAIKEMVVRGAPAIGIAAAYGVVLSAIHHSAQNSQWLTAVENDIKQLANSRPTAVNLFWALDKMRGFLQSAQQTNNPINYLLDKAREIHRNDLIANQTMGKLGAELLESNSTVITHCNAGALATGGYGTALGVIRSGWQSGRINKVYADETRPWLQGSRLTCWELARDNIPATLVAEGAAAWLMKTEQIDWIIVGADRIAANGDVANKIGTYSLALCAQQHGVKVMVAAPCSTIDISTSNGDNIPVEYRSESELLELNQQPITLPSTRAWNPVFDVTPASMIDVIVTESGIARPKTDEFNLSALLSLN